MTTTNSAPSGAAPEDRQCRYTLASGRHCRRWAVLGHEFCHQHARWMDTRTEGPIEVPALEDPDAVNLVLSQTARALAWGHIPAQNGRALVAVCRSAQIGFAQSLAAARFRLKLHQLGLPEQQFLPQWAIPQHPWTPPAPTPQPVVESVAAPAPAAALNAERSTLIADQPADRTIADRPLADRTLAAPNPLDNQPHTPRPTSICAPCIAALAAGADSAALKCQQCPANRAGNLAAPPVPDFANPPATTHLDSVNNDGPQSEPTFRDLKKNWDLALQRAGDTVADMVAKRADETHDDFRAAHARPFDDQLHIRAAASPPIPASAKS